MSRLRVFSRGARVKTLALGSTALSLVLLTGGVALAQTPALIAPAAGTLPGAFSTNQSTAAVPPATTGTAGATYTVTDHAGTITVTGTGQTNTVLQWGGSALAGVTISPTGSGASNASNNSFSIGSGASLTITGATGATLINDLSGNASQIYGALTEAGASPLYIANPSGIVVGVSGTITAPSGGLGLLGYPESSSTFGGTVSVADSTSTGVITISQGSSISGGPLLIAGAAAVNVGVTNGGDLPATTSIVAGYGFSTTTGSVTPTAEAPFSFPNTLSVVNFTGGTSAHPITPTMLLAGNDVNNSGQLDLAGLTYGATSTMPLDIVGTFSNAAGATVTVPAAGGLVAGAINNAGTLIDATGVLTANGIANPTTGAAPILTADITNTGAISTNGSSLAVTAGSASGVTGNFNSTGTIIFSGATANTAALTVSAANINLGGKVTPGDAAAASSTAVGPLLGLQLNAGYYSTGGSAPATGVVDISANSATGGIFTNVGEIAGQAVRILAGSGVTATTGSLTATIGTGSAIDPFIGNATLGYNFSLFPNSVFAGTGAATTAIVGTKSSATSPGSNVNLNGVVSSQATTAGSDVSVTANNINGSSGFGLANNGTLVLNFSGNVNEPPGRSTSGAYQYNYVPVTVGYGTSTPGVGTATVVLSGPSVVGQATPKGQVAQMVNLLVDGNVSLGSGIAAPVTTGPIFPINSYANNHLVVQATGNISLSHNNPGTPPTFYWPGLVILSNVASVADPLSVGTGSITLGDPSTPQTTAVILENLLPADTTKVSLGAGGQAGHNGVFFNTKNLVMVNGSKVVTSNFSWVNFIDAATAAEFQSTQGVNFLGGFMTSPTQLITQQLPADDFQPKQ